MKRLYDALYQDTVSWFVTEKCRLTGSGGVLHLWVPFCDDWVLGGIPSLQTLRFRRNA